ncbi:MAG: hypothetical protein EOP49_31365, partial [Sphingobacteriales bacterium]
MKEHLYTDVSGNNSSTRVTYLLVLVAVAMICMASSFGLMAQQSAYTDGAARAGSFTPNPGKVFRTDNNGRSTEFAGAKLASFTARADNGQYLLNWETVIEENVKQYEIEFSYNNKDYQRAGVVVAADKNTYAYNHVTAAKPIVYYRLKIVETNGSSAFSNAISVTSPLARPDDQVSPTIIRDGMLNITLTNSYKNLQVFNNAGVEVFRDN